MMAKDERLWRLLWEIKQQATRHKRAVSLKQYLLHDLDVIESLVSAALADASLVGMPTTHAGGAEGASGP